MGVSGVHKLTERQKEILRLLLEGYDAKSAARQIGISVHTVNEHLREARRSLAVSSSREAARLLREAEVGTPNNTRPHSMGVVGPTSGRSLLSEASLRSREAYIGVALMIALAAVMIALSVGNGGASSSPPKASPKVVATKPSAGGIIRPGAFTLAVTFDQPMIDGNYSFVQVSPETYPRCEPRPQLSPDARTFTLRCTAEPDHRYELWFNRSPYMNFKSLSGAPAHPYQLRFRASSC
jgi:DNA-binding CsgD family transcriptional regulator